MNLTLVVSRKYRWPEHYFSIWFLGNTQKLLARNKFLVGTIVFILMNISFFSLRFNLLSIITREVDQIRNNVVCVVARLVFLFCCALTTSRCNAFQRFIFPYYGNCNGPYFQTMLFLVTMLAPNML